MEICKGVGSRKDKHCSALFRTVPSDKFQGVALANLVLDQGGKNTFLVQEDAAYGNGLAYSFTAAYTAGECRTLSILSIMLMLIRVQGFSVKGLGFM